MSTSDLSQLSINPHLACAVKRRWSTAGESPARELGSLHPEAIGAPAAPTVLYSPDITTKSHLPTRHPALKKDHPGLLKQTSFIIHYLGWQAARGFWGHLSGKRQFPSGWRRTTSRSTLPITPFVNSSRLVDCSSSNPIAPYCGLRFSGFPIASKKMALLPSAWGEKNSITS